MRERILAALQYACLGAGALLISMVALARLDGESGRLTHRRHGHSHSCGTAARLKGDPVMNIQRIIPAILATALATAVCAAATPEPAVRENLIQKTATIEAVDAANRMVKLRLEDGTSTSVKVSEDVQNLPQVKPGDKVTVSYYQALAAEVKKPGEGVKGVETSSTAVKAPPGGMPAAGAGLLIRTTVVIDSVDTQFNTVTFTNADGLLRTVAVQTPQGEAFIKGLKKGDHVEIAYTEALAIKVTPAP
jgi:hypothetical protein